MKLQRAFFVVIALAFVVSLGSLFTGGNNQKAQVVAGTNSIGLVAPISGTTISVGQTLPMTCQVEVAPGYGLSRLKFSWFQNNGAEVGDFVDNQYSSYLSSGNFTENVTIPNITPGSNFKLQCVGYYKDLSNPSIPAISKTQSLPMNFVTTPAVIYGCTDPTATNYNSNATQNDGSCTYPTADTTAPTNPTNLAVSGATSHTLNLSWTASTDNIGVTQYKIYRNNGGSTSVNTTTPYAIVNVPATTYTDIGLISNTNYKYRIVAVDASGNISAWGTIPNSTTSTTAKGTTLAVVRPTNLSASNPTQSTITLSWTTPASGEIYDYEIFVSTTTTFGTTPSAIIPASGANNTTLTYVFESNANITLQPNTTYYFKVRARDPAANKSNFATKVGSGSATVVSAKTLAVTTPAPNAPTNLNVTATGSTTATATWTDNSTNETGFTLQRATNSGFTSGLTTISSTISANTQSFNVTGLSSGAIYYFRVRANASTSSGWNTFGSLVMPTDDTSVPTVTIDVPNDGQVFSAGTPSTQFSVTTNENATCKWSTSDMAYSSMPNTFTPTGTTTHTTTVTLADGASYTRYVRCQDTVGNVMTTSENVAFSVASPVDTTAPAIPTLSVGAVTSTTVALSWNTVTDPSSPVTYKIYRNGTYIGSPISGTSMTDGTTTPLVAGTTYTYTISACDNAPTQNCSAQSSGVTATTTAIPTIVSSLEVVRTNGTSVSTLASGQQLNIGSQANATYTPLSGSFSIKANPGTPAPTSIKFDLTGPTGFTAYTQCESSAPYALYGDVSGVFNSWPTSTQVLGAYTLTVTPYSSATCAGSAGTPFVRQFILANFDDSTPPTNPSGAASTYRSAGEIRLSWTASTDTGGISHYNVTRVPGTTTNVGNQTTFIDTNVTSNGTYSYTITAVDNVGNTSGVSNAVSAPTLSTSFANGNQVETNTTAGIKVTPDATGNIGNQAAGIVGVITNSSAGPINPVWISGGANYWYVDFATGTDGWVNENDIDTYVPTVIDADIDAPTDGQVLTSGTTTVTMYVTSNENATCKWATTDIAYASMTNTFNGFGTTSHNYPLLGLTDGTSYTRYVRCQDMDGNSMTTSASVTFSVATGAPSGNAPVVSTPKRMLSPNEIGIIINSANPVSSQIAEYYRTQRGIPASNVVTLNLGSGDIMSPTSFNSYNGTGVSVRQQVINQLNNTNIQAFAFAGEKPFAVGSGCTSGSGDSCMSITSALAMGYSTSHTGGGTITSTNYYNSASLAPRQDFNYIPTMMVAGRTYSEGQQFINKGVQSDNSYSVGKVYSVQTTDHLRSDARRSDMINVTPTIFDSVNAVVTSLVDSYCSYGTSCANHSNPAYIYNYLKNKTDVLGYHTGLSVVPEIPSNTIKLGALAEHVTSFGGYLTDTSTSNDNTQFRESDIGQMPVTVWLEKGFVASAGTVQEPWCCDSTGGLSPKFPVVSLLWNNYYTGAGALEAYAKSVQRPGQTLFVGDPLANPWKDPQITFANNILSISITHIKPGETWKLQSSTNGTSWTDVSGQTSITSPSGKLGLKAISVSNATASYYRLVNTNNASLPQIVRPVNGSGGGGVLLGDNDNPVWSGGTSNLVVGGATTSSLAVSWSSATDATSPVTYKLQRRLSPSGSYSEVYSGTATSFSNTGLSAGTLYDYQVRACDAVGMPNCTSWSTAVSGTTLSVDITAPTVPGTPTVTGTTSASISLSWTASTDAVGVTGYKIFRSSSSGGTYTEVGTSATNSYTNTGLSSSTTYYYKVSAYDAANNNSAQSGASSGIATQAAQSGGQTVSGINGPVGPSLTTNATSCTNPSGGTIYYVDAVAGNDTNNGTSVLTAWKSVAKVTSLEFGMSTGTMICFKRGQTHYGNLKILKSGTASAPIIVDAYGTGTAPIISGNILLTGWTQHSGNIWKTTLSSAPASTPKYLFVGSAYQTLARQPNTGWYYTESRGANSMTDTDNSWLSSQSANSLVGAVGVYRASPWSFGTMRVTGNSGATMNVERYDHINSGAAIQYGLTWSNLKWGYILRNKLAFLDTQGEWFFDSSTNTVYLWAPGSANPNSLTVELSSQPEALYLNTSNNVKVRNLIIEGATSYAVRLSNNRGVALENLEIRNSNIGIHQYGTSTLSTVPNFFANNYVHDLNAAGISSISPGAGEIIEGNVVERISVVEDRIFTSDMTHVGIIQPSNNGIVRRNIVRDTGYAGIAGSGSGLITENLVERSMATLTDGSGITFDATNGLTISKNIIKDIGVGSGQNAGSTAGPGAQPNMVSMPILYVGYSAKDKGIYWGNGSVGIPNKNTTIDGNIVVNTTDGIWIDHSRNTSGDMTSGNKAINNTVFDFNRSGIGFTNYSLQNTSQGCEPAANSPCFTNFDNVVTGNKLYGIASYQNPLFLLHSWSNGSGAVIDWGTINNNYYYNPFRTAKIWEVRNFGTGENQWTLAEWRANRNEDTNSTSSTYTLTNTNQSADIFYNATGSPITQSVNGCNANGTPLTGTQTIQPFTAIVVEYGNC